MTPIFIIDKKISILLVVTIAVSFFAWFEITTFADSDKDSVMDSIDNCPLNANWDQFDFDFDGIGRRV